MRKRIIIADDDSVFQKLLALEFERRDVDVDIATADNGERAMQLVVEQLPHLMLLDLRMPKEDGFAVLEQLRAQSYDFPVLVLTHFHNDEFKHRCLECGAKEYLVKNSLGIDQVAERVMHHLG